MRVVLAPDSFKGSLSAPDVCAALGRGIARALPDAQILARPMADGGEGTLDAVLAAVGPAGWRRTLSVQGAGGGAVEAAYGEIGDGTTATVDFGKTIEARYFRLTATSTRNNAPFTSIAELDFKSMAVGTRIQPGDRVILAKPAAN